MSGYTTNLWTGGAVTPLDEGPREETPTGHKVRPIVLCECLVQFAEDVEIESEWETIRGYTERNANLGVGTPDGNLIILRVLESWVNKMEIENQAAWAEQQLDELKALLGIDLTNSDGEYYRSGAIEEVAEYLPELMGLVISGLQNGKVNYWQMIKGEWVNAEAWRGGYQGKMLITVLFCCSLIRAQRMGLSRQAQEEHQGEGKFGYQDDKYLAGILTKFAKTWPSLREAIKETGHTVNEIKSGIYIPAMDAVPAEEFPPECRRLPQGESLKRQVGGIKSMGTAAQGKYESMLGPYAMRLGAAKERVEAAEKLSRGVVDYLNKSVDPMRAHAAWVITQKCIKEALAYDIRITPRDDLIPHLDRVEKAAKNVVDEMWGVRMPESPWQRLRLPGPLGGGGMRMPAQADDAAFVCIDLHCSAGQS